MRYCFDIETDGFLDTATKVHCIILKDIDTNKILHLNNEEAVKKLEQAELIIGHNIIKFDIPVLKKFYNLKSTAKVFDTIVATRLLFPDIPIPDNGLTNFHEPFDDELNLFNETDGPDELLTLSNSVFTLFLIFAGK